MHTSSFVLSRALNVLCFMHLAHIYMRPGGAIRGHSSHGRGISVLLARHLLVQSTQRFAGLGSEHVWVHITTFRMNLSL